MLTLGDCVLGKMGCNLVMVGNRFAEPTDNLFVSLSHGQYSSVSGTKK